jgi:hypothetical protein
MSIRKLTAATAAASVLALAGPVAAASAGSTLGAGQPQLPAAPLINFTPPTVGTICSVIGPIIIGNKVMNPGLNVCTPPVTVPLPPLQSAPSTSTSGS